MIYPLVICYIAIENGPIEIDNSKFSHSMVMFHCFLYVYQAGYIVILKFLDESHPPDFSHTHVMVWINSHTGINGLAYGKIGTGNHRFSHEDHGFPVTFPLNQSIDGTILWAV